MIKKFHNTTSVVYLFFVSVIFFNFYLIGNQNVREILNNIPKNEKEALEELFYNLFDRNNFSYSLFGDKPMSLAAYFTSSLDEGMPSERELRFWNKCAWKNMRECLL